MGTTIARSMTAGLRLSAPDQNPLMVTPAGTINVGDGATDAVYGMAGTAWQITNLGSLRDATGSGIDLASGGRVVNGNARHPDATIRGGTYGVQIEAGDASIINSGVIAGPQAGLYDVAGSGTVTVHNHGSIRAGNGTGIVLETGSGTIVNGSPTDTDAQINARYDAIQVSLNPVTVLNYGTIHSTLAEAVNVRAGGRVTNGTAADRTATISSSGNAAAILVETQATDETITNFGTISGAIGVAFGTGSGTVTNAGTIIGHNGVAVQFGLGNAQVVMRPGAVFVGQVIGGRGHNVLELAAGNRTGGVAGIGTKFCNFGTVSVDSGARWALNGVNTIGAFDDDGTVLIGKGGQLEVASASGSGAIQFLGNDQLTVDQAGAFGTGVGTTGYSGPLLQDFVAGDSIDLRDVAPGGLVLNYTPGNGLLQIGSGGSPVATLAFENASLGAGTFHAAPDGVGGSLITHA